jgi:EAL domain-containing protein (putative c-di-GMP-specific phosphodiesterase class I)
MARGLQLRVIAEGVETQQQLTFLRLQGCDEVQGYLFSRPVPPNDIIQLLSTESLEMPR